jgi:hypothetical protein
MGNLGHDCVHACSEHQVPMHERSCRGDLTPPLKNIYKKMHLAKNPVISIWILDSERIDKYKDK